MGGASSALKHAEKAILNDGLQWYAQWRRRQQDFNHGEVNLPDIDVRDVDIGDGLFIHTVEYVTASSADDQIPLVCMHGFGTGVGIYYAALPALAERWHGRTIALDTLGCGLSSRPRWTLGHGTNCPVEDAEDFFVSALERWREAMKIDRMVLMGHSLGGYLAAAYAERHPGRVERLILVSAVGTPEPPAQLVESQASAPFPFNLVLGAWASGFSPFSLAKAGLANSMLSGYVRARFSDASWVLKSQLKEYLVGSWSN